MSDHHHSDHAPDNSFTSDQDLLLVRAVAGDLDALDEIRQQGAADPQLIDELAMWQFDELRLARLGRQLDACADRAEISDERRFFGRSPRLGWAVAAAIAIAWIGQAFLPRSPEQRVSVAGIGGAMESADDAFDKYIERAREEGLVRGDVAPPTLVGSRELGDGRGFEVIVVRQIIERRIAPEMYRAARTGESGMMRPKVIRPRTDLVQ